MTIWRSYFPYDHITNKSPASKEEAGLSYYKGLSLSGTKVVEHDILGFNAE